jgi:hypothetical protein
VFAFRGILRIPLLISGAERDLEYVHNEGYRSAGPSSPAQELKWATLVATDI